MRYGFGISAKGFSTQQGTLLKIVRHGEDLGFDFLTVSDHIIIPRNISSRYPYTVGGDFPSASTGDYLEQITLLSFVAGVTHRLRLVPSIMVIPHRSPVLTAKMLATLDVLSGGRVVLGAGSGWMEEEFNALELPPFEERGAVTDEYLRAFKELWTKENPNFAGKYCQFSDITFLPKPIQKPHIPIWIGGHSRRSLKRAAELGNGWHPIVGNPADPLEPDQIVEELGLLKRYAGEAGRKLSDIELIIKASLYDQGKEAVPGKRRRFTGSAMEVADDISAYEKAGATSVSFDVRSSSAEGTLERMEWLAGKVIPRVTSTPEWGRES